MQVWFADPQLKHEPETFLSAGVMKSSPEQSERAHRLLSGAQAAGLAHATPEDLTMGSVARVHRPDYLAFLETIHARWSQRPGAAPEVIPNVHIPREGHSYPTCPVGLAGWHQADTACPIGPNTWEAACWSAATAVSATRSVMAGARAAYALSRPPGHHAYADLAGGFCFLNNAAIAAEELRTRHERVAILDVDVHHGNGTQGIFYARGDVLTVSMHADPHDYYPYVCGHARERGTGAGEGANMNLPLPRSTGDDDFLTALDLALAQIARFQPGALVVALGLDAHEHDPLEGMKITTAGFERIGARIGEVELPTVLVQEGGYLSDALSGNLTAFLTGYRGSAGV